MSIFLSVSRAGMDCGKPVEKPADRVLPQPFLFASVPLLQRVSFLALIAGELTLWLFMAKPEKRLSMPRLQEIDPVAGLACEPHSACLMILRTILMGFRGSGMKERKRLFCPDPALTLKIDFSNGMQIAYFNLRRSERQPGDRERNECCRKVRIAQHFKHLQ